MYGRREKRGRETGYPGGREPGSDGGGKCTGGGRREGGRRDIQGGGNPGVMGVGSVREAGDGIPKGAGTRE